MNTFQKYIIIDTDSMKPVAILMAASQEEADSKFADFCDGNDEYDLFLIENLEVI